MDGHNLEEYLHIVLKEQLFEILVYISSLFLRIPLL